MNTIIAIIGLAYAKYIKQNTVPIEDASISDFLKLGYNTYNVDENYNTIFIKPINVFFKDTLGTSLSPLLFEFRKVASEISCQVMKIQTRSACVFLFAILIGLCANVSYLILAQ